MNSATYEAHMVETSETNVDFNGGVVKVLKYWISFTSFDSKPFWLQLYLRSIDTLSESERLTQYDDILGWQLIVVFYSL